MTVFDRIDCLEGGSGVRVIDARASVLVEEAILRKEGTLANNGALVVKTGKFTGRSPKDKYFVEEIGSRDNIWWGPVNHALSESSFASLRRRVCDHLRNRDLFIQNLSGGADKRYQIPVRVVTEYAWHSLFARQLLVRPFPLQVTETSSVQSLPASSRLDENLLAKKGFTILVAPGCHAVPEEDGTQSETFIAIHLAEKLILIGGTEYAGEIKKSVFTILNYLLPLRGVFPMHCSANVGHNRGDTALFFGLSGTGKTTLSADPSRDLIGDDEHGWSDDGIFNFEGGCYAKCIHLSEAAEPQIWSAIRFGSVLENVVMDPRTGDLDYESEELTENTRAAYPIDFIPSARIPGVGGHPRNVVFLTADAFGVLPPISRLTPAQARYHFLSGYTAKLAGTERGLGREPQATFSACFGQPFLPLHPTVYSRLLGEKLEQHGATVWLVNTGWQGGPYGVGQRISLPYTRALVNAAVEGALDNVEFDTEPVFGLRVPRTAPGVPSEILTPRRSWQNPKAYDAQAKKLAELFVENFERYRAEAAPEVLAEAPNVVP